MARWVSPVLDRIHDGADVIPVFAPAIHLQEKRVGEGVYVDFLPKALETGQLKPKPDPKVIGHGVESLQDGVDQIKKGVSATKLVVTL